MVLEVTKREFKNLLNDISCYALVSAFLLVATYFFFNLLDTYNQAVYQQAQLGLTELKRSLNINTWIVSSYYQTLLLLTILFAPSISAGSVAQERIRGTLELLLTLPLKPRDIILGKFFSCWALLTVCLLLSSSLLLLLYSVAAPDFSVLLTGFMGLIMCAAAFVAISLACSALVKSSVLAGVLALAILLLFYAIHIPAESLPSSLQAILRYFSPLWQLKDLFTGILTPRPLVYFGSLVVLSLSIAISSLHSQRLRT